MLRLLRQLLLCIAPALGLYAVAATQVFGQAAALLPNAKQTFLDGTGKPLAGGTVTFYVPGSTTKKTTWSDNTQTSNNTNPVVLDAAGRAVIFGQGAYRQVVKNAAGVQQWDAYTNAYGSAAPSGATGTDTAPVGTVMPFSGFTIPTNWQLTYGQALSRTDYSALLSAVTISSSTTTCTASSTTLSGFSSTAQIRVGAPIEATCIPTGTTVASIASSSSITVSNAAVSTGTVTAVVFPWGNGDGVSTFNVPDLRGRVLPGADAMGGTAASRLTSTYYGADPAPPAVGGGNQSKTIAQADLPNVTLSVTGTANVNSTTGDVLRNPAGFQVTPSGTGGGVGTGSVTGSTLNSTGTISGTTASINGGVSQTSIPLVQPSITINYIIKVKSNSTGSGGVVSIGGLFGDVAIDSTLQAYTVGTVGYLGCTTATSSQIGCSRPDNVTMTVSGGVLTAIAGVASSVDVAGSTLITNGTSGRVLFDNAGAVGEKTVTGSGGVVLDTSPSISAPTITGHPTIEGVTATGATGVGMFVFNNAPSIVNPTFTGLFTATGLVKNTDLANSATTVNGQTCTLGSTCTVTSVASQIVVGTTTINGGTPGKLLADVAGILGEQALGAGVSTALATNIGSAGAFVAFDGALGTPSSGTLTNATGLPISSGVSGLGTGVATALAVNIGSAGAPVLFNGAGGTPSSMVGTNITGTASGLTAGNVTTNANLTGPITSVGNATSIAAQTGTGTTFVMQASPTITTPNFTTGFTIGAAAASGNYARGNGTNFVSSAIQAADLPLAANTSGSPSATAGAVKCDGTTTSCASGVITSIGGVASSIDAGGATSITNGTTGALLFDNAGVIDKTTNPTTLTGATITANSLTSLILQDASSSQDTLKSGVSATGGWTGSGPGALVQFAPNSPAAANMMTVQSERILQLAATSNVTNTSANPTMYLGDATSSCCLLPGNGGLVRQIPGVLFEYGNQQTSATGPGPFTYNILSKSKNTVATTGANARDVHLYLWNFEDPASPRSGQPVIAFWSASGDYSNPSASVQGANIWEIGGFAYCGTYDYCINHSSFIRGTLESAATGTTSLNASSPGNMLFFTMHSAGYGNTNDDSIVGGFYSTGTFAVGQWAAYGNNFNTGDATITVKEGGTISTFTSGAGVFYVDSNGSPRYLNNNASGAVAGNYYIPVLNADNGTSGHPVCYTRSGSNSVVLYVAAGTSCP